MLEVSGTGSSPSVMTVVHRGFFLHQIYFKPAHKDSLEFEDTGEVLRPLHMFSGMDVLAIEYITESYLRFIYESFHKDNDHALEQ